MRDRIGRTWLSIKDSLWFVPATITVAASLLAFLTVWADSRVRDVPQVGDIYLAFEGGVEGARGVLDAIAGTMITVTGVVFSLTIIALQLASSQFSPSVLRSFMRDRGTQVVMGTFIGTFIYSLLVLRQVRSAVEGRDAFIPAISVAVAIGLAIVSIALLIYYIHHVARSIQASSIVDRVTVDANGTVARLFPEPIGVPDVIEDEEVVVPAEAPAAVRAERAGYLQAVQSDTLFALAKKGHFVVRMEPPIGSFVLQGSVLASVWPASALDGESERLIRAAFVTGRARTLEQDAEYGIRQLADIAVKAFSPGINDPTTAMMCIDRLGEVLVNLGTRCPPEHIRRDEDGVIRFIAQRLTFERAVELAFSQIRHYGIEDAYAMAHLLTVLARIAEQVPPSRRPPLRAQATAILQEARQRIKVEADRRLVEHAGKEVLGAAMAG